MDKYDALFVRALKSKSPKFRVKRLYQKIYYHVYSDIDVCKVLSKVVQEYDLMSTKDWIDGMNPANGWMYGISEEASYYRRCVEVMTSFIRLTPVSSFDNYPMPAVWRNK
jgi:hypothetical protein